VAGVDGPSRFYVLWRYTYKTAEMDAGEAIVFTYTQHVELDGPQGLSGGSRSLVEKKKGKYRLRDFSERGDQEKLGLPAAAQAGLPGADGAPVPLIDILHRVLYLMEHYPRKLAEFLEEALPDRERLRLLAQVLGGVGLAGGNGEKTEHQVTTTPAEKATLGKLLANWRHLIEQSLGEVDPKTGQQRLGF
jgi:putative DNA methylase